MNIYLKQINQLKFPMCFSETFPISVKKKIGINNLLEKNIKNSPNRNWIFENNNKYNEKDLNF